MHRGSEFSMGINCHGVKNFWGSKFPCSKNVYRLNFLGLKYAGSKPLRYLNFPWVKFIIGQISQGINIFK